MQKLNCWEKHKCERQPGGSKVRELGVCPAATDSAMNGLNGGSMSGRICWRSAGTMCGGKIQGTWAEKLKNCSTCDFYKSVRQEEGENFKA